jgi:hypothetical protein
MTCKHRDWTTAVGGDYYDWLSSRMGHRDPWRTWARLDKRTSKGRR